MKKKFLRLIIAIILLASSQTFAQTTKPSQESLKTLFEITEVRSMIPKIQGQLNSMTDSMMQELMVGRTITPDQQKALDAFRVKIVKIEQEEISWESIEPRISEIYEKSLNQADVDGIIAFYRSPAGAAYVKKMPEIMQQSMLTMQKMIDPMMKKMERASEELKQELQRADQKK